MSEYQIIASPESMTITVGPKVFDQPMLHRAPEWERGIKIEICGEPPMAYLDSGALNMKVVNQFFAAKVGPKFNRRFQAANYWLWLGNRMQPKTADMLRHTGMQWRSYSPALVYRANRALAYVNEAERDGLFNLIPAIVIFGDHPSAIRKLVGGATWKRIAHNSKTRNRRMMQAVERHDQDEWAECFVRLLDWPSGVLGGAQLIDDDETVAARLSPRRTPLAFRQTLHTIRDARRMLGTINPQWSMARIQREHDAAMREVRQKRYGAAAFTDDWSLEKNGYTAALLTSPLDIALEGDQMHHCVASYAHMAESLSYAVVRIDGRERATAGFRRVASGRWQVDQVYGACNSPVSAACNEFSTELAKLLPTVDMTRKAA